MPKYLMLIFEPEEDFDATDEAVFNDVMQQHGAFSQEVGEAGGTILGGEALQPIATASYLRGTRSEQVTVVDNPAPDLKEMLGGYYVVEARDDDHARTIAGRCPAGRGYIEVRPVWEIPGV